MAPSAECMRRVLENSSHQKKVFGSAAQSRYKVQRRSFKNALDKMVVAGSPWPEPLLLADAEGRKNQVQNVSGSSGSGKGVEFVQNGVKIKQQDLVR